MLRTRGGGLLAVFLFSTIWWTGATRESRDKSVRTRRAVKSTYTSI